MPVLTDQFSPRFREPSGYLTTVGISYDFQASGTPNPRFEDNFNYLINRYLCHFRNEFSVLALRLLFSRFQHQLTMRINNIVPLRKLALLSTAVCAIMLAFSHNAHAVRVLGGISTPSSTLTFNNSRDLGQVLSGIPSGDANRLSYVNHLIHMALGTTGTFSGQTFHRSSKNPGPGFPNFPNATLAGLVNGTGTSVNLGPTAGVYLYLFAKYDGPNGGSEVWYVGDLSGVITIPAFGLAGQHYGLSGWTLFRGAGGQVPDGGTTVMLLGAALGALSMARHYLKS